MNLFHHFLHLLSGSSKKPAAPVITESKPNNCEYLLANLQRICAMLPDGEASVVMGRNKLDICLTWDTTMQANADKEEQGIPVLAERKKRGRGMGGNA